MYPKSHVYNDILGNQTQCSLTPKPLGYFVVH